MIRWLLSWWCGLRWKPIETYRPGVDPRDVMIWTPGGHDIGWWEPIQEDGCQEPGHNPGWWGQGGETWPGRTREHGFGGEDHWIFEPQNQPTHWRRLPYPPGLDL